MIRVPDSWDFIIVGAGSAGAVLASRLSGSGTARVLLLEAGPDWVASADLPDPLRKPSGDYQFDLYEALPDFYWQNLEVRPRVSRTPERYLRGRGTGGSSTVNGCYAIRPPLSEFDGWVDAGCAGWGSSDVLPYFNRLEADQDFGLERYHGSDGPIPIRRLPTNSWGTMDEAFCGAAIAIGHQWLPDHSAPDGIGVSPFAANIIDGRRVTTNDGYLSPARSRSNLVVIGGAHVDRVLLSGTRAIGVSARIDNEWQQLYADEIFLCAGAPLSPAILERSGVGVAEFLRGAGIEPVVDLPVGEMLQDHPGISLGVALDGSVKVSKAGQRSNVMLRWNSDMPGTGPGDLMACANPSGPYLADQSSSSILGLLNQPFSRGSSHIRSHDPFAGPDIEQCLVVDEQDRSRMRLLSRHLADLLAQPPFAGRVRSVFDSSGSAIDLTMSDASLDRWVEAVVRDTAHVVGTCRMGDPADASTVVDPHCRVLGIEGLRVVDAAVFPRVPRANTNLTVIMLAEKVADLVIGRGPGPEQQARIAPGLPDTVR